MQVNNTPDFSKLPSNGKMPAPGTMTNIQNPSNSTVNLASQAGQQQMYRAPAHSSTTQNISSWAGAQNNPQPGYSVTPPSVSARVQPHSPYQQPSYPQPMTHVYQHPYANNQAYLNNQGYPNNQNFPHPTAFQPPHHPNSDVYLIPDSGKKK